jgi:ADP-ribose pyrophosphatase YjhB (NUDIX family)
MGAAAEFLASLAARAEEEVRWGELRFHVASYLGEHLPPLEFITSARAVVLREDSVLVVRDPTAEHILPGGRREAGETLRQTLQREVLEETGWALGEPRLLGFKHFRHLQPKPAGYAHPYPDFFQAVYVAEARGFDPGAREADGYELGAGFRPLVEVERLSLPPNERVFLRAALAASRG